MIDRTGVHLTAFIHPGSHIADSRIGARTRVWQFASVIRGSVIGNGCNIAACAIVDGASVGDGSLIGYGAFLDPGTWIGARVFIGPHVVMCNDAWPRVDKFGFNMAALLSGEFIVTRIEDGASVGATAIVMPGVVIGAGAMVAAGATVDRSVPAGHLLKRSGEIVPIDNSKPTRRMRRAV